jgi:hypothetical protein
MKRLLTKGITMTIDWSEGKVAWSFFFFFFLKEKNLGEPIIECNEG